MANSTLFIHQQGNMETYTQHRSFSHTLSWHDAFRICSRKYSLSWLMLFSYSSQRSHDQFRPACILSLCILVVNILSFARHNLVNLIKALLKILYSFWRQSSAEIAEMPTLIARVAYYSSSRSLDRNAYVIISYWAIFVKLCYTVIHSSTEVKY
jgi:hypothetical protein